MNYPKGKTAILKAGDITVKLTGTSGSITLPKTYKVEVVQLSPPPVIPPASGVTLMLTPNHGVAGTHVQMVGEGFKAYDRVHMLEDDSLMSSVDADASGHISYSDDIPPAWDMVIYGKVIEVSAVNGGGDRIGSASFTVDQVAPPTPPPPVPTPGAAIVIKPASGGAGTGIQVYGTRFGPEGPVTVVASWGTPVSPFNTSVQSTVDALGVFSAELQVPVGAIAGTIPIVAMRDDGAKTAKALFVVNPEI